MLPAEALYEGRARARVREALQGGMTIVQTNEPASPIGKAARLQNRVDGLKPAVDDAKSHSLVGKNLLIADAVGHAETWNRPVCRPAARGNVIEDRPPPEDGRS
jgi:hypothetical protein